MWRPIPRLGEARAKGVAGRRLCHLTTYEVRLLLSRKTELRKQERSRRVESCVPWGISDKSGMVSPRGQAECELG